MMERIEKMRVSDDALDLVFRKGCSYSFVPRLQRSASVHHSRLAT